MYSNHGGEEWGMKEETSIGPLGNKAKNGTLAIIGRNRFSALVVNKVSQDEE